MPSFISSFFKRRRLRKIECFADQQYLEALDIIKSTMEAYLDLLAEARQDNKQEDCARLEAKLNGNFEYQNKSWDGEIKIVHNISSTCSVKNGEKRLKIEKK